MKNKWHPRHSHLQRGRWVTRSLFFLLFLLAPVLNVFRLDLTSGHFILFGNPLSLGLNAQIATPNPHPWAAGWSVLTHALLPAMTLVLAFIIVSWRFGRLYCAWLCPHFSMVETINGTMTRWRGRPTLWEPATKPVTLLSWIAMIAMALLPALVWAVVLLTYLLPPLEIFHNLLHLRLTPNQSRFIAMGTGLLFIDFFFARHLFCRFGCAVGMFQSLIWMANRAALAPVFTRDQARTCLGCPQSCDRVCPMRLKPRGGKNKISSCAQCGLCLEACDQERGNSPEGSPLRWRQGTEIVIHSGNYTTLPDTFGAHRKE
ncbi:MAG: 4Fe-4S binding protein [Magnetococcales bacterium]|nr:4Fe-4S binding protein [Magnetococcales bacterium]